MIVVVIVLIVRRSLKSSETGSSHLKSFAMNCDDNSRSELSPYVVQDETTFIRDFP